jgi:hypothetical protein
MIGCKPWQRISAFLFIQEFKRMRTTHTNIPVILAGEMPGGVDGVLCGDIDRCCSAPDCGHGDLIASAIRWAAMEPTCLRLDGPGYLDCNLYLQEAPDPHRQPHRLQQYPWL